MIKSLIKHQWLESVRSIARSQNMIGNILFGLIMFILILNFLALGLFVDIVLKKGFPDKNPVTLFNSILLFYFSLDIIIRFFFQRVPAQSIKPYLHLPVSRKKIVHFLLAKSGLSFFNLLPLFIAIPFAYKIILPQLSLLNALSWLAGFFLFLLINSLLNFYFQKQLIVKPRIPLIFAGLIMVLFLLNYFGLLPVSDFSSWLFYRFIANTGTLVIPLAAFLLLYFLNFRFLFENIYLEDLDKVKQTSDSQIFRGNSYLERFGETGTLMALELKLLLRNKRSKTSLYFSFAILLFGLFIYTNHSIEKEYYPKPDPQEYQQWTRLNKEILSNTNSEQKKITFRALPQVMPDSTYIYVVGNHPGLGKWKPSNTPMIKKKDGSWEWTILAKAGEEISYTFTLGSWESERVNEKGKVMKNPKFIVANDTTIVVPIPNWQVARRPFMEDFWLIYFGLFITGALMLIYGQFLFSWEAGYFDLICTANINLENYIRAKYLLLVSSVIVFFILSLPFGLINSSLLKVNFILFLYNAGVNTFMLIFLGTFTRKKLDLRASIMSTQGKGASQFLFMLPTLLLPVLLVLPFYIYLSSEAGFIFLAGLGSLGLLFHSEILRFIVVQFKRQRYKISAGFKQS